MSEMQNEEEIKLSLEVKKNRATVFIDGKAVWSTMKKETIKLLDNEEEGIKFLEHILEELYKAANFHVGETTDTEEDATDE